MTLQKQPSSKKVTEDYKANPTAENYVRLRRKYPLAKIEIGIFGGLDPAMAMEKELTEHGIEMREMIGLLDADQGTISEISLRLIEELDQQRKLKDSGETQLISRKKAMPIMLIDWLIAVSLDAMSWNDSLEMNRDLMLLIRMRLIGEKPLYERKIQSHEQRSKAIRIAAQLHARREAVSVRKVAKFLDMAPSTISRFFNPGEFEEEYKRLAKNLDKEGMPVFGKAKRGVADK